MGWDYDPTTIDNFDDRNASALYPKDATATSKDGIPIITSKFSIPKIKAGVQQGKFTLLEGGRIHNGKELDTDARQKVLDICSGSGDTSQICETLGKTIDLRVVNLFAATSGISLG